jgi:hypothetical protein
VASRGSQPGTGTSGDVGDGGAFELVRHQIPDVLEHPEQALFPLDRGGLTDSVGANAPSKSLMISARVMLVAGRARR